MKGKGTTVHVNMIRTVQHHTLSSVLLTVN